MGGWRDGFIRNWLFSRRDGVEPMPSLPALTAKECGTDGFQRLSGDRRTDVSGLFSLVA